MAHDLARWTARIGLAEGILTTKTLRRRLFGLVGRLTRSGRRLTLHLPGRWPWANDRTAALGRLRAIRGDPRDPSGRRPTLSRPDRDHGPGSIVSLPAQPVRQPKTLGGSGLSSFVILFALVQKVGQ